MSLLLALTSSGGATSYSLNCAAGAYALTGQAAALSVTRKYALVCGSGAYVLTGNSATLTYSPGSSVINYALNCDSGAYLINGNDAELIYTSKASKEQYYGGWYDYEYVKRKKSVDDERRELGIIPKEVKKIIKKVVKKTINEGKSENIALEVLNKEIKERDLIYRKEYDLALEQYRSKMIQLRIGELIRGKIAKEEEEDEYASIFLLM